VFRSYFFCRTSPPLCRLPYCLTVVVVGRAPRSEIRMVDEMFSANGVRVLRLGGHGFTSVRGLFVSNGVMYVFFF